MKPRSRRIVAGTLAVLVGGAAAVAGWALLRPRPFDPRETGEGKVLVQVGEHAVMTSRARSGGGGDALAAHRAKVRADADALGLGAPVDALLSTMDAAASGKEADTHAFYSAGEALNRAFFEAKRPYFVDTDLLSPGPVAYGYYAEREDTVRIGEGSERALFLFRVDRLAVGAGALGYTRERSSAALVLLSEIESDLVVYVLPSLAPGEPSELIDERSLDPDAEWQKGLRARGGEVVRETFQPKEGEPLLEVGKILARRRALIASWTRTVAALGHRLRVPESLVPEADYHEDLARRVPRRELVEWDDMHGDLVSRRLLDAFVAARDRVAESVERHEVQHRADYRRGLVPVPKAIADLTGVENPLDVAPRSLPARARDEHSAFLAQIAESKQPALDILLVSRFAFDASQWGGPYTLVAIAILDELAARTGKTHEGRPLVARGAVQRKALAELFVHLSRRPPGELRAAARAAWEAAYEAKLPEVKVVSSVVRERFRPSIR